MFFFCQTELSAKKSQKNATDLISTYRDVINCKLRRIKLQNILWKILNRDLYSFVFT